MGYSTKITKKNEDRILSKETHNERVKESFQVAKEMTTLEINHQIAEEYKKINDAIDNLDEKDFLMGVKKHQLQELRHTVASRYAINKKDVEDIQESINAILEKKNPNIFKSAV